jgi:AcrR family transcriptional regulator
MPENAPRNPLGRLQPAARNILAAARRVLRERGMAGLTLEAVANEANTSRTQVPYHFGSRAGLIEALFDWLFFDSWSRFMSPGDSPWPMTVHQSLEWSRQEMTDLEAIRDSFDLVVHSLRDESVRNRLAMLYRRDRRLEVEALGCETGSGTEGTDRQDSHDAADRRLAAIGAVLLAIDEGLALQRAIDPAFDLDGAFAAAEAILTHGLRWPDAEGEG